MAEETNQSQNSTSSIDYAALRKATLGGVTDIPFTHLISEPLRACVAAQNESHQTTIAALREMGIFSDKENNQVAASVGFEFVKDGRRQKIMVPLITLVPINFLQINAVTISFKASIKASSSWGTAPDISLDLNKDKDKKDEKKEEASDKDKNTKTDEAIAQAKADGKSKEGDQASSKADSSGDGTKKDDKSGQAEKDDKSAKSDESKKEDKDDDPAWWREVMKYSGKAIDFYKDYKKSKDAKDSEKKAEYSNKKDSKVTQESKYSIETTVDFEIQAGPADMPGGLAKIIETLNNAIITFDPAGELQITPDPNSSGRKLFVRYLNEDGILAPSEIECTPNEGVTLEKTETGVTLTFSKAAVYTIKAGKKEQSIAVAE
ncbi:MAG: DUF2589 domain-containing protein [Porphyromonadaceae bacterium]|nr:DUF2589 domain-containing protein [Porphyromonadaceae bacterium]